MTSLNCVALTLLLLQFVQMIIATEPLRPLQYTVKGTPRRQICLKEYSDDITEAYKAITESSHHELLPPSTWEYGDVVEFMRKVVNKVLGRSLSDEDDLFQHGADRYCIVCCTYSLADITSPQQPSGSLNTKCHFASFQKSGERR